METIPLIEIID